MAKSDGPVRFSSGVVPPRTKPDIPPSLGPATKSNPMRLCPICRQHPLNSDDACPVCGRR
jgi:hypothetical protein